MKNLQETFTYDSICYTYGYDHQRIRMEEHVGNAIRTKRYVGSCEYVAETNGGVTSSRWLTYLTSPTGVYAVVVTENGTDSVHYILKDHLGSWTAVTDSEGDVEQRLSYDAWGNLRDPDTWSGPFTGRPMFDRGFTGHEHLTAFGLINMNGRMYDPMMSSFLSVDRYVQNPVDVLEFNRYAYCGHNPLRFVDPSGWQMKPTPCNTPTSDDDYRDIYTYVERALEPRDLGLLQLPTDDPTVVWMEGDEMHVGGAVVTKGGWYRFGNEICWSSTVSSQSELDAQGINGTFLGQNYIDEKNRIYYSLLGFKVDMKEGNGLAGEIFPLIDLALCKYENDKLSNNSDIFDPTISEPATTNFGVVNYIPGGDNLYSFVTNEFIVYLQVFDGSSGKRENSMNAAFCGLSSSSEYNPNNHYQLSRHTTLSSGYDLYFNNPYANPRCWRVMIVFPTIPVRNDFINRYNSMFGYGNH